MNTVLTARPNQLEAIAAIESAAAQCIHRPLASSMSRMLVLLIGQGFLLLQRQAGELWDVVWRLPDCTSKQSKTGLPMAYAQGAAEDFARQLHAGVLVDAAAPWRQQPASEKRLAFLQQLGWNQTLEITKGEASDLISIRLAGDDLWQAS